jgi:hypothetical protein
MFGRLHLDEPTLPAQFIDQNLCYLCYWHAAIAMHFLFMKLLESNYCAYLSATSCKAEFVHSAFADVQMLQFNSP